jgi:hypothetical protein
MRTKGSSKKYKASKGQSLTEYGFIFVLIGAICIGSLGFLEGNSNLNFGNFAHNDSP